MNRICQTFAASIAGTLALAGAALAGDGQANGLMANDLNQLPAMFNPAASDPSTGTPSPFQPRVAGCLPTTNCQEYGTTTSDGRASCVAFSGNTFVCADNFALPGTGTVHINQICFWGYFGLGTGGTATVPGSDQPQPGAEAWRVRILPNVNGKPDTTTPLASFVSGANGQAGIPGWDGVTYTGTLTRGASAGNSPLGAASPVYLWTITGLNIAVPANTCMWLEIGGATNGTNTNNRTRWSNHSAPATAGSSDRVIYQYQDVNGVYQYTDLVSSTTTVIDRAFCVGTVEGGTINQAPASCNIPPIPTNATCATATTVSSFPFTQTNANTLRATNAATPFCGRNPVNSNTIWYKVVGNGTTVTVDTCGANTNFDTVINVYCAPDGTCGTANANLLCVANNDTGPAACVGDGGANTDPSQVSFVAATGSTYYVGIFGFQITNGFLDVSITSDGVQAANPPSCVSDRCPLALTGITNVETDACGTSNNSACNGTSIGTFTLGQDFGGTCYNLGNTRDFDFWEYNTATPLPDNSGGNGTCWLLVNYQVEFPGLFNFFTGPCNQPTNNGTFIGGADAEYRALPTGCGGRGVLVGATAGSQFRINMLTVDFGGVPCATGNNNYKMNVALATVGACCQPSTVCQIMPQVNCLTIAGSVWNSSGSCTPTDFCAGVCCTGTSCVVAAATDCTAAGTSYIGGSAGCTPNPCLPQGGVCCRGATCNTTFTTSAACAASLTLGQTAGASFTSGGSVCNSGAVSNSPCCYANYNKVGGVSVQDIFDFLGDWFAGSPFANTGGNGSPGTLSVQNIFDFLTDWFAGGC